MQLRKGISEQVVIRHLAAALHTSSVAELRNGRLLRAIRVLHARNPTTSCLPQAYSDEP
jgi:hypothetical protein